MPLNDKQRTQIAKAIELLDEAVDELNSAKQFYGTAETATFYAIQDAERLAGSASSDMLNLLNSHE